MTEVRLARYPRSRSRIHGHGAKKEAAGAKKTANLNSNQQLAR